MGLVNTRRELVAVLVFAPSSMKLICRIVAVIANVFEILLGIDALEILRQGPGRMTELGQGLVDIVFY